MRRALCLVESNRPPGNTADYVRAARGRGLDVLVMTSDPASLADASLTGVEAVTADTQSGTAVAEAVRSLPGTRVAGVTTAHDFYVPVAAEAAALLGLPGPDPEAVRRCRRKDLQRADLARAGVPQPRFRVCRSVAEAVDGAVALGFPVVVKPVGLAESIGVRLCATGEEIAEHAAALLESDRFTTRRPVPGGPFDRILVESCAEGREFAVEVFDGRCVGVTETSFFPPPGFVEYQHTLEPLGEGADGRAGPVGVLQECAAAACEALSLRHGPVHIEMRLVGGVPHIIEVNPRLAGDRIPALHHLGRGIDLWDAAVCRSAGLDGPLATAPTRDRAATVRLIGLSRDAEVDTGPPAAATAPAAGAPYTITFKERGVVTARRPARSSDTLGWALAHGQSAEECAEVLDGVWRRLGAHLPVLTGEPAGDGENS